MRKLFLSSSFKDVAGLFPAFAGEDLKGKTVTFIPTAALHEKVNFYVKVGKKALEKLGLAVDELDISSAPPGEIAGKLQNNHFIYVTGGNTFFLLQALVKSGAGGLIKEQIGAGKLYIGESAGSMVLSPNIAYVAGMDDPKAAPEPESCDALHVVDFYPLPHRGSFPFKKAVENIISQYEASIPLVAIGNKQAITVEGDAVKVIE